MTDDNNDIDAAEFEEQVADIESPDEDEVPDADPVELLSFTDLLDIREDLHGLSEQLDSAAGYWAQVTVVLEQQAEAAEAQAESDEKAAAITQTAEKAREAAERIDGGAELLALEQEIEDAEAEAEQDD